VGYTWRKERGNWLPDEPVVPGSTTKVIQGMMLAMSVSSLTVSVYSPDYKSG
jgi:hypothetical protein